jgi:large repetitive protein
MRSLALGTVAVALSFLSPAAQAAHSLLLFQADGGVSGAELWRSGGLAKGTFRVKDILPGPHGSLPSTLTAVGSTLFFVAEREYATMDPERELWRSDGTAAGTRMVADTGCTSGEGFGPAYPRSPVGLAGRVFFTSCDVWDETFGEWGRELWRTDGTRQGTRIVKQINPDGSAVPSDPVVLNGALLFRAYDGVHGSELWKSDGTRAGTVLLEDTHPGDNEVGPASGDTFVRAGDQVFFVADDGSHGMELWVTDGTAAGTSMVEDINTGPAGSVSYSLVATAANGVLYFGADDGAHGTELWRSDGTGAGTYMVEDLNATGSSFPGQVGYFRPIRRQPPLSFASIGGMLYFTANDGQTGMELWSTDGTPDSAMQVANINTRARDSGPGDRSSKPAWLASLDGRLLFAASDGSAGMELWRTDGTTGGTVRVKDIDKSGASYPNGLTRFRGRVYFEAGTLPKGRELWRTDGTRAGTELVEDINPGSHSSSPTGFAVLRLAG